MIVNKCCSNLSCKNLENLKKQLKRAWKKIDPEYIRATCNSAEARFEAVRKAAGGHIK